MRSAVVIFAVVTIVLGVVWWKAPPPKPPQPRAPNVTAGPHASVAAAAPRDEIAAGEAPGAAPAQHEYEARAAFHQRVRTFFAQAPALAPEERRRIARELDGEIEAYESRRELSAAEALTLRLALIRESAPEQEQLQRMEALRDQYQARDVARAQQSPDPMFELYKAREQEIVAHVQSLREIPGGLTREEYLRERLQQEREALFGESGRQ